MSLMDTSLNTIETEMNTMKNNALEGITVQIGYMFHSEQYIDGIFDHCIVGGEKKYIPQLKELHGFTWKPPILDKETLKELCPELTKQEIKELRKFLKAKTKEFHDTSI